MFARTMSSSLFGTMSERQSHSSKVQGETKSTFSAAVTKRRWSMLIIPASFLLGLAEGLGGRRFQLLKLARQPRQRSLNPHALQRTCADETNGIGAFQNAVRIRRSVDRSAVAQ